MLFGFHLGPYMLDLAIGPNQEGNTVGALIFTPHECLLTPDAIGLHYFLFSIGQQRERELVFLGKLKVRLNGVCADA